MPSTLLDCRALVLLHVTMLAGPIVVERRSLLVSIWNGIGENGRDARGWARWIAGSRPLLEQHAKRVTREQCRALVSAEALRRRAIDARLDTIDAASDAPLAAHFIQRSLFDMPSTLAHTPADRAPREPWGPLGVGIDVDVPLILVPTGSSRLPLHTASGMFVSATTPHADTTAWNAGA